jgi:hypothetical protein
LSRFMREVLPISFAFCPSVPDRVVAERHSRDAR